MGDELDSRVYQALFWCGSNLMWTRELEVGTQSGWIGMEKTFIHFEVTALRDLAQKFSRILTATTPKSYFSVPYLSHINHDIIFGKVLKTISQSVLYDFLCA
jgi:hypothetical protein